MAGSREIAIAADPNAYENIGGAAITTAYSTAADTLDGNAFVSIRPLSFSDSANRDVIIEEAVDQVAAASVFGGTYGATGQFEAAFRPVSMAAAGLIAAAFGKGALTSTGTESGQTYDEYELQQEPSTVAIKIVDEQATTSTGSKGTTTIYRGVGVTGMDLSLNVKEYARATFNWIARTAETWDVAYNTQSTISDDPSIFYNAVLSFGGTSLKCKGVTISLNRAMDQDYFFIGSEFLQGLYYNGLTELGGSITLGAGDWDRLRTMIAGSSSSAVKTLDQTKTEFSGDLANYIPEGTLVIQLMIPDGTKKAAKFTVDSCKLTEMSRSVQGRNQFEKSVNWRAELNETEKFTMRIYTS